MPNSMKKAALVTLLAVAAGVGALVLLRRPAAPGEKPKLKVYCGTSMRLAAEELAPEFARRTGTPVEFDFGGSETLLPRIEMPGDRADVFIAHDPFGEDLMRKGLAVRLETVGYLEPVLVVAKGNPLGIRALADLARPGVRVGLLDARYSTCGELTQKALEQRGVAQAVRANVKVEKRSHQELAADLVVGGLDAIVVWNFTAALNRGRVDVVPTGDVYPETRLTVCTLKNGTNPEQAAAFLDLCASPFGREVFTRHGYIRMRD